MLNEERVKHMTRMAMVEEKENRKLRPVLYYSKKDYLSLCTIGGVFAGTLVYGILYVGAVAILFGTFFVNLSLVGLILGILLGLVLSCGAIILMELFDELIHDEDYLIETYHLPILAVVPDLQSTEKSSNYYYKATDSDRRKKHAQTKKTDR